MLLFYFSVPFGAAENHQSDCEAIFQTFEKTRKLRKRKSDGREPKAVKDLKKRLNLKLNLEQEHLI